ncbi:uncharacterized protein LOC106166537 [Lingula anatina]|uniref:Uncharacterized protein LOC106166537 n=1 Tax=Lingula anatina TaxID=7574 RepID=A0A1S3IQU7_LINAN|nr:uncharacterized protein LOC106166537 [Lingula anatina]|eukprot:XP_013400590.1 uncharacterized protein LOC106166537 [Lingula anatina]
MFHMIPGKYLPNAVLETKEQPGGISRIECAAECQSNPKCKSFNIRSANTVCELNSAVDFTPTKVALVDDAASRHYTKVPHDCADYYGVDGVHCINVNSMNRQLRVSCEEGWTVLMRRTGPDLSFDRPWLEYRDGFGDVTGDHWLGLEAFHHLTNQGNYSFMVEVKSLITGRYYWESHHGFRIGPESEKYVFNEFPQGVGNLSQNAVYWSFLFDMPFSTFDAENDNDDNRNCAEAFEGDGVNGVHNIYVKSMGKQLRVSCEAGWTVLMRRTGPDLNFNRSWTDYRIGFGDVTGDYWLGLEAFHHLTYQGNYSLMVEVRSLPTDNYYWEIHHGFRIGPESEKYVFSEFSQGDGTLIQDPEYWPSHFGMPFTTFDNDNDDENDRDCAELFQGGWWYRECTLIALTARMATTGNCTQFCFAHFKHFGVPKGERGVKTHLLNWAVMKIKKIE